MPDLSKLKPNTAGALASLRKPKSEKAFPIKTSVHAILRTHDLQKRNGRRAMKAMILPENCAAVLDHLPAEEGDRTHAIIAGDFIFCDLLLAIAKARGRGSLAVSTLSLSMKNVAAIAASIDRGDIDRFDLILSHYFQSTSKELFQAIERELSGRKRCRIVIARTHCKLALFETPGRVPLTVESSANLRSCGNLEHVTIFADEDLARWHRETFEKILPPP